MVKKPDTLTHLTADKMVAKSDPRLGFRAALDSAIALTINDYKSNWRNHGGRGFSISARGWATLCAPTL